MPQSARPGKPPRRGLATRPICRRQTGASVEAVANAWAEGEEHWLRALGQHRQLLGQVEFSRETGSGCSPTLRR